MTNIFFAEPSPSHACAQTYPIHLAACSLSLPVLEILLEGGAFVNQTDADMWTTLHFAALTGWADGIRMLLEVLLCIFIRRLLACSVHEYLVLIPTNRLLVAGSLLQYKADPNAYTAHGSTPLQVPKH